MAGIGSRHTRGPRVGGVIHALLQASRYPGNRVNRKEAARPSRGVGAVKVGPTRGH
jgi:hypothetical protein